MHKQRHVYLYKKQSPNMDVYRHSLVHVSKYTCVLPMCVRSCVTGMYACDMYFRVSISVSETQM